jgi:hypothetical protein
MIMTLPIGIGIAVAAGLAVLATSSGLDRDRAYYPVMLIVVASYYVLFATMGGSTRALLLELAVMAAFTAVAVAGFRGNLWLAVSGLAAHGLFDVVHERIITNAGMPAWWPAFCSSIDIAAAIYAAWLLASRRPAQRSIDHSSASKYIC